MSNWPLRFLMVRLVTVLPTVSPDRPEVAHTLRRKQWRLAGAAMPVLLRLFDHENSWVWLYGMLMHTTRASTPGPTPARVLTHHLPPDGSTSAIAGLKLAPFSNHSHGLPTNEPDTPLRKQVS